MAKTVYNESFKCEASDISISCADNSVKFKMHQLDAEKMSWKKYKYECHVGFEDFDRMIDFFQNSNEENNYNVDDCWGGDSYLDVYKDDKLSLIRMAISDFYLLDARTVLVDNEKFRKTLENVKNAIRMNKVATVGE